MESSRSQSADALAESHKVRAVKSQRPPHPSSLRPSWTESWLRSEYGYEDLPRPSLRLPQWVRSFRSPTISRILVSFRTLLCSESLFVELRVEELVEASRSEMIRTVDLCVPSVHFDEHGLPVLPEPGNEKWETIAHDLLVAGWFAHVQHVAELVESSLRELDRGRVTAATVLARTGVEMAARAHYGLGQIQRAPSKAEQGQLLQWFVTGEGRLPVHDSTITQKISALETAAATYLEQDAYSAGNLYSRLCDRSHPRYTSRDVYLGDADDACYFSPLIGPLHTNRKAKQAANIVLDGVVVASAGMLSAWNAVDALLSDPTHARSKGPAPYIYGRKRVLPDNEAAYPEIDHDSTLAQAIHQMLEYTIFNDDSLPLTSLVFIQQFVDKHLMGRTWPSGGTDDRCLRGWKGVRLWICSELEQALVASLNRVECASASALARFLLEHIAGLDQALRATEMEGRVRQLRDNASTQLSDEWIEQMLRLTNMSVHATDSGHQEQSIGRVLKQAANGLVHADLSARSMYWARYEASELQVLYMPSRPEYPQISEKLPLDSPWTVAGSAVLFSEALLIQWMTLPSGYPPQQPTAR